MDMFGESSDAYGDYCYVRIHEESDVTEYANHNEELKILVNALSIIKCKYELKIAE